jgi:hypothetical protein
MMLVDGIVVHTFFVLSLVLSIFYFNHVKIERPPFGHFNWKDLVVAFVFIMGGPFAYLAFPEWAATIAMGLVFLALLNLSISPVTQTWPRSIVLFMIVGAIIAQYVIFEYTGSYMFSNALALVIFMCIGPVFVRNGLQPRAVALFATGLLLYDVVATLGSGFMMQFVEKMLSQPYFLGFATDAFLIGGGDVVLSSIFVSITVKYKGPTPAYYLIGALIVPLVVISVLFYAKNFFMPIPYLIIATPVYLLFYYKYPE